MGWERGQATIEWVGLVLLVALALAALARVLPRPDAGRELGVAVAERIGCAVRDGCGAAGKGPLARAKPPPVRSGAPPGAGPAPVPGAAPAPGAAAAPGAAPSLGAVRAPGLPRELVRRFPRLARVADLLSRKAWVACFGYESFRFDLEHRNRIDPNLTMSPRDAAGIANACLNPYSFFPG
jgi:hypothetical protein